MSQGETLLVVHNPYGLELDASGVVSEASLVNVSYWLDHFLRPEGERRRALDAIYYKRNRYDGRIIVVLTNTIDWTQPRYRSHLERGVGAHEWQKIVKERYHRQNYADMKSFVFEFDQKRFIGKRLHVQHFGYSATFYVPRRLDDYQRDLAEDARMPIVVWQNYPPASWCKIPRMTELLELPIRSPDDTASKGSVPLSPTLAPTPGPDMTDPSFFKTNPYKDATTLPQPGVDEVKPGVKREPGVKVEQLDSDVKPRIKREVKFEDDDGDMFKRETESGSEYAVKTEFQDIKRPGSERQHGENRVKQESRLGRKRIQDEEDLGLSTSKKVKFEERE